MKKWIFLGGSIALWLSCATTKIDLFNGKDLRGWQVYGTEKWYVDQGELICESGPDKQYGYLATKERFKNFDVSADFKLEANGNSGLFFRSSIDGTKITGWQAEVAPQGTGGIYESYGRGWLKQISKEQEAHLNAQGWNTLRVRAEGPKVTTWLNGHEMIQLNDSKVGDAQGQIALQIHDGGGIKVRWKNIVLKKLP